ncbi:ribosomal protection-like ABC-F family protein [Paenibacillus farraposensis]|uniref:Ribosomal protection-like ABC-F family protein n=1 Tax=Paenibacillus farraposensis TaxID=2807095 RepID=A0ABW4D8M6_9BACL|nr:ABC-F type ribosomal protection protein [Paenibacillus farraposensis]MCC3381730.1 ABC-F type ribosomal protection protein [Paenibacillus farraposensis]
MKTILRVRDVVKEWNGISLFEHVSLDVAEGERLALFGRNGAGKTTLLRILLGDEAPTSGKVEHELPPEERGWLKQQNTVNGSRTALEAAQQASPQHWGLKQALRQLEADLAGAGKDTDRHLERYGALMNEYERLQGFAWESEVEKALTRMGMPAETWSIAYGDLSGGQKTRVRLAGLMVSQPKLLVLDEPTNHLDAESLLWLEQWLSTYHGTLLFVSHDRAFLDKVATSIVELTFTGIERYKGGYQEYKAQKERELREQETQYRKQELARKALEETIRNYNEWFNRAHRAASKVEMAVTQSFYKARANKNISRYHAKERELERLEANRVEKPREAASLHMKLSDSGFQAKYLLRAEQVGFSYGDRVIVKELNLNIARGDRLAVRGPNGIGKTTLLRLLTGQLKIQTGSITANPQLNIGYFSQELEQLPEDQTLLDSLLSLPTMTQTEARTVLGCFLFAKEDVFKRIGTLSMGEKCRAAFLRLYFSGANLLVLDEPTNYFDIETREIVENSLRSYDGAMVLVSHDRELIRCTATRLLDMKPGGGFEIYEGTADEKQEDERSRQQEPEDQEQREERMRLELRLTELMGMTGMLDEHDDHLREIRRIRARLNRLDFSSINRSET